MEPRVISVKALEGYHLEIVFDDGLKGVVEIGKRIFGPVFEPLKDRDEFTKVFADEFGAVCWPCGADLAPDALYEEMRLTKV